MIGLPAKRDYCVPETGLQYVRGTIVNRTIIVRVKIGKHIGFYVYHRSYLLWPPVIKGLRSSGEPQKKKVYLHLQDISNIVGKKKCLRTMYICILVQLLYNGQ